MRGKDVAPCWLSLGLENGFYKITTTTNMQANAQEGESKGTDNRN